MILLTQATPEALKCCQVQDGELLKTLHKDGGAGLGPILSELVEGQSIDAVAHFVGHGGAEFDRSVTRLLPGDLSPLERCIRYQPECNARTYETARYFAAQLPGSPQFVCCDTGCFSSLPGVASNYGIPRELRQRGLRRFGGYGLCHERAWERTVSLRGGRVRRLVSVYLGNTTNVAAMRDGLPVETTMGFTSVEGIPSDHACGDIDPTILDLLFPKGISISEITGILTTRSGLTGLMGRDTSFRDLMRGRGQDSDGGYAEVWDLLLYHVQKNIGAFVASLGGVDAIAFSSEYIQECAPFIDELAGRLAFLGLKHTDVRGDESDIRDISAAGSRVGVVCLHYDKWKIMAELVMASINREVQDVQ